MQEDNFLDQIRFSTGLSLGEAMSRGLSVVMTAILFALLSSAGARAGPLLPMDVLLVAFLVTVNNLGYVELALKAARPGNAYTLIHEGSAGGALAFTTGWALLLCGLGFSALLAQGGARHVSLLLSDLLGLGVPVALLAIALTVLAALENLVWSLLWRKSGRRLAFALSLIVLLLVAVVALLAAPRLRAQTPRPAATYPPPGRAIPLLAAAFVGLEVIVGHQGEFRRRAVNLPRIFLSTPLLVGVLGALLAFAIGSPATEVPLVAVGEVIGGPPGRAAILALGSVITLLSLSQTLTMAVRLLYVMIRDGFWPSWLGQVRPRSGVAIRSIVLVGLAIVPLTLVPTGLLSQVSGLLYLFTLMIVNLTLARKRRQDSPVGFALPFHPWVPALTLAMDVLVVTLWDLMPVVWTAVCLAVGFLFYLVYGRSRYLEAQEGVTIFRPVTDKRAPEEFRVLVPIANPDTAGTLLRLAGCLARPHAGDVLALQVVVVPEAMPLEAGRHRARAGRTLLDKALALANDADLPIQTMTRVARSVAQGILDTAVEEGADLIVLGWSGPPRSRGASLGQIVDAVLRDAPCDVVVMRGDGKGEDNVPPKKILVPTAGGPHAQVAARLALALVEACQSEATLLCIQTEPATAQELEEKRRRLEETVSKFPADHPPELKVVRAPDVVGGIVQEAREHDLVLLGVSEESLLDQIIFGSIPLRVAASVPATVLVQGYRGLTGLWMRRFLRALRENVPILSDDERSDLQRRLTRDAQPGTDYFVLIVLSCIIAALGLLLSSPAVVIGAMLVAPLMSPIMAFSLGLIRGDFRLIRSAVESIFEGVTLAVLVAAFIGLLSPLKIVTEEILARAQPNLLDLAVALVSGIAGAYAIARKDVSDALPGVAIAAALMPPLAAVGLGIALGDLTVAGGALLLFATNIAAISLAGGVVFLTLGVRPQARGPESRRQLRRRLILSLLLLLTIAFPLGVIMSSAVERAARGQVAQEVLAEFAAAEGLRLVGVDVKEGETDLLVVATLHSDKLLDSHAVVGVEKKLSDRLGHPVRLEMIVLPIIRATPE